MAVKIALPKGKLLIETARFLAKADWQLNGYNEGLRNYRLKSKRFPDMLAKVFQEKDIPIQVAIGNYDLGICGLDWIEELTSKYSASAPVRIRDLGYGKGALYVAASSMIKMPGLEDLRTQTETVRIASEYPNIAESFALNLRLRRFSIYPLWGAAEAYPPESATLALVAGSTDEKLVNNGLKPLSKVLNFTAYLIANRISWEQKDLSEVLATLEKAQLDVNDGGTEAAPYFPAYRKVSAGHGTDGDKTRPYDSDTVRLALPDGHQQKHMIELLNKVGIHIDDYPSPTGNRRPSSNLEGVVVKVIRPQDMPLQVANGNFDLAITGKDWLTDHLNLFPASPVQELADLKLGWVRIVAVVNKDVPADNIYDLQRISNKNTTPIRVASEYVNIADKYARDNRLGMYRIIPTWGATEAFLPEDADLLIENTETGSTIARHNLKIIDTLFESTARLIGAKNKRYSATKKARINKIIRLMSEAIL
ncbi:MAG: ATP phosphoribosyltransferase [Dehalococcoidales bacterium]|nr:ATP phosphoribosyltransferase [Dehalococcoidales bacterium]